MFSDDVCSRCIILETRIDQLEAEIRWLKRYKPLRKEFIKKHNIQVASKKSKCTCAPIYGSACNC